MDKPFPDHRFENLAQSCLTMWNRYFRTPEVHQHVLKLARLLDLSENTEQARLFTLDSHLLDLKKILSPSEFSQTLEAFSPLCQFFTERGAFAKNPFVFSEDSLVKAIITHQNPPPDVLKKGIQEHLDDRVSRRKLAVGSISAYRSDLNQLFNYLIENNLQLTVKAIEAYAISLTQKQKGTTLFAESTIARKKNAVRAYLRDEIKRKNIELDEEYQSHLITSKKDKTPKNRHTSLNLEEVGRLIAYIATLDLRSQLEILLPLLLGARANEVVGIQVKRINFIGGSIELFKTKNGLPRTVPVPAFLEQILNDYVKLLNLTHFDYLFPNIQRKAISPKTLTEHIKVTIIAAGIKRPTTTHDFRATYANLQYYHNQIALAELQELMGHEDIATTLQYVGKKQQDRKPPLSQLYLDWSRLLIPNWSTKSHASNETTALYYYSQTKKEIGSSDPAILSGEPIRTSLFRVVK